MNVNSVNNASTYVDTTSKSKNAKENIAKDTPKTNNPEGVVYEKSSEKKTDSTKTIYSKDSVVAKLKADQEARIASMQSLVEKLLSKQGQTFNITLPLAEQYKAAAQVADPETIEQAKKDIADDGYWGVEKTSDRLVEMAKALSGGNTSKADLLIDAVKKGFEDATKAWGEDLPEICQKTLDATIEKLEAWKNGTDEMTDAATDAFSAQAIQSTFQ